MAAEDPKDCEQVKHGRTISPDTVERLFRENVDSILSLCQRFPWNGQLMSTCEAELQELMKQIDIMVQNKKAEWERELQTTEAKLQLKERECTTQKTSVELKAREINQLRQQIDSLERNHRQSGSEYERNLEKVKSDFEALKRDYEKLQKKMTRHNKEVAKEKSKASTELQDTQAEVQRAQTRLEEYRQRSKDWDLEKRNLEKQIESLESQRRTLQEKCDLIEHQATGYQSQLDKRRQILDNTEYNLKTQITQLECQIERAQDTISTQETQISKLKASLDETISIQRRVLEEKDFVERELREIKKRNVNLEDEIANLRFECQKQEEYIRLAESGQQTSRDQIQELERTILQRGDSYYVDMMNDKDADIKRLADDLKEAKSDIKQYKKNEKRLNDELTRQKSQIRQAEADVEKLRVKFEEKMGSMKGTETKKVKELQADVSKLKQKLSTQSESSEVQISDLKRKVSTLKDELQERLGTINSLKDHSNQVESRHRQDVDKFEQRAAELQVANAQLEALRLENRHLRQTAMKQIQTNADVMEAEAHLKELQNAYTAALSRIESENKNLQHQLNVVQSRMRELEQECGEKERQTRSAAQRSIQELQSMEERRIQDMQSDYEKRLNNLQLRMDRKLRDAQLELDQTLNEKSALEQKLKRRTEYMQRAFTENEVMSHFVEGVSEVISQSDDPRMRMVTPRLIGVLDEPFINTPYDGPHNFPDFRTTKTSTKVHFNDSDLPNQSLIAQAAQADSPGLMKSPYSVSENVSNTADKGIQYVAARPKTKANEGFQSYQSDDSNGMRSLSHPDEQSSTKHGRTAESHQQTSSTDVRNATSYRLDMASPSKAPSPGQGSSIRNPVPSPLRLLSPLRIPSPGAAFARISPNQRTDHESSERIHLNSTSTSDDRIRGSHDVPRPGSAPLVAPASTSSGLGAAGGGVDLAAIVNLSLSDVSDTERPPSRASLATRFYEEEQQRTKELEKLIDAHIEDLKRETEKTIRKYAR